MLQTIKAQFCEGSNRRRHYSGARVDQLYRDRLDLKILEHIFQSSRFSERRHHIRKKRAKPETLCTTLDGYVGISAAIPTINVTERLAEIDVPCRVIVGADDIAMPLAFSQTLVKHLPHSELTVIPDAGHLSNLEQPERFNAVLKSFYDRVA